MSTETTKTVATETPYLFLTYAGSQNPNTEYLVAKKSWFEEVPTCQLRNSYGIIDDDCYTKDENDGECCCETATAYEYWDGSNHQHLVINAPYDVDCSEETDEDLIAELTEAVENKTYVGEGSTGYTNYEFEKFDIVKSIWQGDWELFTITLKEDKE